MIKIAIIDDNPQYVCNTKELLQKNLQDIEYSISEYSSAESFLKIINETSFDIIFLDILLGHENGIDLGVTINSKQPNANIIFISVNSEYFKDVYKVTHSYFLTKEFEEERFKDAITKAIKNIHRNIITITTKTGKCKIVLNNVLYFENSLRHTKVYMLNGDVIEYNVPLKTVESLLPRNVFFRTHQSFIVNISHIKRYDRQHIYLEQNKQIPISRSYITSVREKITCYLGGML